MKIILYKFYFLSSLLLAFNSLAMILNAQITNNLPTNIIEDETTASEIPSVEVILTKKTITKSCQYGNRFENVCPKNEQNTKITVLGKHIKNRSLTYIYTVSGGHIIGEGSSVIWDFTDTRPGYYTIIVEVSSINGIKLKSEKETIILEQCGENCGIGDPPCSCPNIKVTNPSNSVKAGETIEFTANIVGVSQTEVTYNWYIQREVVVKGQQPNWIYSNEIIIEGQSTSIIKVKTTPSMAGETLIATFEIGRVCLDCHRISSAIIYVIKPKKR